MTKDVPDHALMIGNPAVIAGWMCACGEKLTFERDVTYCHSCRQRYERISANEIKTYEESNRGEFDGDQKVSVELMSDLHSNGEAVPG